MKNIVILNNLMEFSRLKNLFIVLITATILTVGVSLAVQNKVYFSNQTAEVQNSASLVPVVPLPPAPPPPQKLANPPSIIKAVYVTENSAGSKTYLNYLTGLFKNTEINAVVVDVKDSEGRMLTKNIDKLVNFFHNQNIYVIGRIAVFEDPVYAKAKPELAVYDTTLTTDRSGNPLGRVLWQDNNGLAWMDPASKDVWDYDVSLAKDALYNGFDEINFDYIRFPTDGATGEMGFPVYDGKTPKADVIKSFFQYLRSNLPNDKISADLFGLTTVSTDDMGIGQVIENAFENFDYVAPMVYPSHYANGFIGFANPADHPYDVIKYSLDSALKKENIVLKQAQDLAIKNSEPAGSPAAVAQALVPATPLPVLAKYRPWLQDFNMGANYTASMVEQEIKATQDSLGDNYSGFMLWNPNNIYTQAAIP